MWGYPAHLIKLRDGRILSTCGYCREPGDVRAALSSDGGMTWDMDRMVVLRDDGGYPFTIFRIAAPWRSRVDGPTPLIVSSSCREFGFSNAINSRTLSVNMA